MRARDLRTRGGLGALAAAATLILSGPAAAASATPGPAASGPATPIGGPQLGGGLAVNLAPNIKALPTGTQAKSWIVADLDTGQVLAAYNPHVPHPPASTLKTLAALALIPRVPPAARVPFTADELALASQKDGVSTRVGLVVGQTYPAKRLFEAMLSLSANDAAEALSAAAPGGRAAVLAAMNGIAASLQARDTHAGTPDGLPADGQTESAYDEALIVRAALQLKNFSAYDTTKRVEIPGNPPFGGYNHDRLQNSYPGVIGGKDGYTVASGQVWWGAASRYGHRLVVVVMDAGYAPVTQEINLLNWGFSVDGKITPVGQLVGPVTSAGVPTTVAAVASGTTPGSVSVPKKVAVHRSTGSGPWRWVLVGLILLAAALLGRRHLRAIGFAGRVPSVPPLEPLPTLEPLSPAEPRPAAPDPATPSPTDGGMRQAPRWVTATELRPPDVVASEIEELPTLGPAAAPEALEAQHDRLHTGSVRIVPATSRPARDEFSPR